MKQEVWGYPPPISMEPDVREGPGLDHFSFEGSI